MLKKTLLLLLTFYSVSISAQSISATLNPNPVEAGSDVTLSITYSTTSATDLIYAAIELKNSDATWAATVVEDFSTLNPVGTTGTNVSRTITLSIPSSTTVSSALTGGQYYAIKVALNDSNWTTKEESFYPITIAAQGSLSVSNLEKLPAKLFPNPVQDLLNIVPLDENKQFTSYRVFDISGKTLIQNTKLDQKSLNVSKLSKGIYFLQLDNYKPFKFMKE